jgi:hypothetical protein
MPTTEELYDRDVRPSGGVIMIPVDSGREEARRAWNLAADQQPAAIAGGSRHRHPDSGGGVAAPGRGTAPCSGPLACLDGDYLLV